MKRVASNNNTKNKLYCEERIVEQPHSLYTLAFCEAINNGKSIPFDHCRNTVKRVPVEIVTCSQEIITKESNHHIFYKDCENYRINKVAFVRPDLYIQSVPASQVNDIASIERRERVKRNLFK